MGAKALVKVVDTGGNASAGRHIAAGKPVRMGKRLRAKIGSASSEDNCNMDDFEPADVGASI